MNTSNGAWLTNCANKFPDEPKVASTWISGCCRVNAALRSSIVGFKSAAAATLNTRMFGPVMVELVFGDEGKTAIETSKMTRARQTDAAMVARRNCWLVMICPALQRVSI